MKLKIFKPGTTIYNFDDKPMFNSVIFSGLHIVSRINQVIIYKR